MTDYSPLDVVSIITSDQRDVLGLMLQHDNDLFLRGNGEWTAFDDIEDSTLENVYGKSTVEVSPLVLDSAVRRFDANPDSTIIELLRMEINNG